MGGPGFTTVFRAPNWCRQYQWLKKRFPFSGRRNRTVFRSTISFQGAHGLWSEASPGWPGGAPWRVSRLLDRILCPDYPTTAWTGPCVTHRLLCLLEVMDEGWLPACVVVVLVVPGHVPTIDLLNVDECFAIDAGTERRHRNRNEIVRVRTSMLVQCLWQTRWGK